MKKCKIIVILWVLALCLSCDKKPVPGDVVQKDFRGYPVIYQGEVQGVDIYCNDTCPRHEDINNRIDDVNYLFRDHLGRQAMNRILNGTEIYFISGELTYYGKPVYGLTFQNPRMIYIFYPYPCEPKGLCDGIFVYELGHLYMNYIMPDSSEPEWLEYRKRHNLLTTR